MFEAVIRRAAGWSGNAAGEYACQLLENGSASDARGLAPPSRAGRAASRREGSGVRSLLRMVTRISLSTFVHGIWLPLRLDCELKAGLGALMGPGSFEFRGKCVTFV